MAETGWETTIKNLKQQLALIKNQTLTASVRFEELRRQAEFTKIQSLTYQLEARRKFLTQNRGYTSLIKNPNNLPSAGLWAAGLTVLTYMFTKDWLNASVRGVNGAFMRHGETEWAVCIGKHLAVASEDHITWDDVWVTWDSLQAALHELEERAKSGAPLGSLDNIISELKKSNKLLFVIRLSKGGATK